MRATFAKAVLTAARDNKDIFVLVGDLGYKMWDEFRDELPNQYANVGAAEQAILDMAVGLAQDGKIPFCYSITSFLLYRPFETLRTYINYENIPVKLVGSGRDDEYEHDGYSHNAHDAKPILDILPNIVQMWPKTKEEIPQLVTDMLTNDKPTFISLSKKFLPAETCYLCGKPNIKGHECVKSY